MTKPAEDAAREIETLMEIIDHGCTDMSSQWSDADSVAYFQTQTIRQDAARPKAEKIAKALLATQEAARAEERAAVVAWLRMDSYGPPGAPIGSSPWDYGDDPESKENWLTIAGALERGDHLA